MILFTLPITNIELGSNDYYTACELFIEEHYKKPFKLNTCNKFVEECCKKAVERLYGKNSGKFFSVRIDKIL